ncbi:Na+:solute symporter [bacterium]|jgi:solute:Na+ symporter, SSS family|nr:Na+:solute symporter [bacterium]MBT3794935.1 Na+:solute symporter [bacterium]MBT4634671.1 Na+:solute symporter [bacterium]
MSYFLFLEFLSAFDLIIISLYLLLSMSIGIYFKKRSQNSISSYFVSERNLPWWLLGTSMVATTLSIDTPIVIISWIRDPGIWKNWFWWSFLFTHCLVIFFFSKYWRRANVITDNQLIEIRYSGAPARYLRIFKAFYFSMFFNLIISAWIISAFLKIFNVILGFDSTALLVIVTLVALFYSTSSGLKGIVINDFIQYFVAFAGSIILVVFLINSDKIGGIGNYFSLVKNLSAEKLSMIPSIFNKGDFMLFLSYSTMVWWSSHNSDGGGYIIQRLCSARSERDGVLGTIWFVLNHYVLRFAPWIVIGLCALILYPTEGYLLADSEEIYPLLIRDYVSDGFRGFLIVTLLAAYMSTISTQINWGSSYLVNDLYKRFYASNESEEHYVLVSKIFTIIFLLLALFVGIGIKNIGSAWIFLWSVSSGLGFFLIARWFWWRINSWSEISALICSVSLSGFFYFLDYLNVLSINFTLKLIIIPISILIGLIVTLITSPEDDKVLNDFYNKIRPDGFWKQNKSRSIGKVGAPLFKAFQLSLSILILIYSIIELATGSFFSGTLCLFIGSILLIYIIRRIED